MKDVEGLTQEELEATVADLHDFAEMCFSEIAQHLPLTRKQVESCYNQHGGWDTDGT